MQQGDKETIGMISMLLIVMAGIQWLLLWLTHWSVAMIVTGVLSFIAVWIYVGLSHASPNGGSKGSSASEYLTPLLWVEGSLLCSLWLLCHLMKKPLPNMVVIVPLGLMLAFGIGQVVYSYIKIRSFWYKNYSLCKLEIENKTDSSSFIHNIKLNSSTRYSMDINPNTKKWPTTYIPRNMNKIGFRFNSIKNNFNFCEFPFDYALCKEKESLKFDWIFWITKTSVLPMKLILLPNNTVELYIDNKLIQQYHLKDNDSLKSD